MHLDDSIYAATVVAADALRGHQDVSALGRANGFDRNPMHGIEMGDEQYWGFTGNEKEAAFLLDSFLFKPFLKLLK